MKRTWISGITAGAVIAVLTLFLGLQYRWLSEASEATRERMHKRVEEDTKRVAADFNREIQGAYFNFQADPVLLAAGDASELRERYAYWSKNTEFPGLIRGIFFVDTAPGSAVARFDPTSGELASGTDTADIAPVVQHILSEKHPVLFLEAKDALLVPLFLEEKKFDKIMIRRSAGEPPDEAVAMPEPEGYVVVLLDREVIREKLLPALSARHFPSGEFNISTMDRKGRAIYQTGSFTGSPDTQAALFDLTPDKLIFFSKGEGLPRKEGATAVINQTIENRTLRTEKREAASESGQTFTIQMRDGEGIRRSAVIAGNAGEGGPWVLQVQHTAGSIDRFVDSERNRSIAIGLVVYLVLAGGILAIVISAQRSWNFAQRQIDFVSSVSHEFRTPLAVIYSASENLADGVAKDREQVTRYGELIKGEGKKLSAMVEQILEFAGARSGKRRYRFGRSNVADVVRDALDDSRPLLDEGGFDVESSIPQELYVQRADAEALSAAISNLIQNSLKYSNGERWLGVSASNGGGSVKIVIEDRGIGIHKADQKRIFEPFYRSKSVVDSQIHGNGLGLSLVKEVMEAHKGSVSVASEPGKGSKFTITIPQR